MLRLKIRKFWEFHYLDQQTYQKNFHWLEDMIILIQLGNSGYEGDVRNYFLAALNYKADSNVWVMPNIVMETYENLPDGTKFDSAITGRITLFYKFN